jgi:NADH:ubiquinone oxidoreductase subunit E
MTVIKICTGRACTDHGSAYLFDRFEAETKEATSKPELEACACMGQCEQAVNLKIEEKEKTHIIGQMTGPKLANLIKKLII